MSPGDRLKGGLMALARAALSTVDYYALYRAQVVSQSGDRKRVDLKPEDPRLPGMSGVPLKLGLPGAEVQIAPGAQVLVGWEGGDPSRPHAVLFEGGATVLNVSLVAAKIELGGKNLIPLLDGVVRGETPCQFTGAPHHVTGGTSTVVHVKR